MGSLVILRLPHVTHLLLASIVGRIPPAVAALAGSAVLSSVGYLLLPVAATSLGGAIACAAVAGLATPPLEPCLRALWPVLVGQGRPDSRWPAASAGARWPVWPVPAWPR